MSRFAGSIAAFALLSATPVSALNIVTDTPVIHALVTSVMGDTGEATILLDRGSDPHAFQLRPSQARALSEADVVFWVGEELTPWLARILETTGSNATSVDLLHAPGTHILEYGEEEEHGSEHDDHAHGHGHDHGHDHGHGALDPHAWLDPENGKIWLEIIARELGDRDPENAAVYKSNADAAAERIMVLEGELRERLAAVEGKPIVTFHDAYGYFAEAFGVEIAGTVALGDAAAPGARHLRELEETLASGKIACIFREPQHDAAIAEAVAEAAGLRLGTLDPSGTSLEFGPGLYEDLLTGLTDAIVGCVAQSS